MAVPSSPRRPVALVTGASRGIGSETAVRLGRDGFNVLVNFVGGVDDAEAVAERIRADGGQATTLQGDVSDAQAVKALFDRADELFGGIDVLVNNAGIQKLGAIAEVSDEDFDELVDVNLRGPFNTLREAAARLRHGGRIINLSSGTTVVLQPTYAVYAATKAGVEALTIILAKELRGRAITVNAIAPGPVATELFLKDKSKEQLKQASEQSPLERLGKPTDIANVVSFLAGPDGAWVNGQTVIANGAF